MIKVSLFSRMLLILILTGTSASATYLSETAKFYTEFDFGNSFEGNSVKAVIAHTYILAATHAGSSAGDAIVSQEQQGTSDVVLKPGRPGRFAGKTIITGAGLQGSGPRVEILGAFVEYRLTLENGSTLTTPTYPIQLTQHFTAVETQYLDSVTQLRRQIEQLVSAFNHSKAPRETAAFEIDYLQR